ncbi:RimK family alpha-L-glutamate ligase [[Mycoplasma] testudinis]|uniref:RimK family alpha-L-glutamate ligase n=1 Tax=[Mycoplasma] testudinis TaxID=33924 RepID=UPI0004806B20|nr:RimK family alpha-L-glutamate ligase [[Mycoplasma] testudinis]
MKKNNLTIIYNPFISKNKSFEQIKLLKQSTKNLKIKTNFISVETVNWFADKKFESNAFGKKILFLDKNIAVSQLLENSGYWVYNKTCAINSCDNKALTHASISHIKIKQVKTLIGPMLFINGKIDETSTFIKNINKKFSYPLVIKDVYGSFGTNVHLVNDQKEAIKIINSTSGGQVIVQPFLNKKIGESIRVIVAGNKVIGSLHQKNNKDFRSNLTLGATSKYVSLNKSIKDCATRISKTLGLFYSGIDFLFDNNLQLLFCEANSNVQLSNASKALNKNIGDELLQAIMSDKEYYKN